MSHLEPDPSAITNPQRLAALELSGLLNTPPEDVFDQFTALAQEILGVPIVLISLVDEKRQFFKSQVGLPENLAQTRETPLSHSFCQYVVNGGTSLIINDAKQNSLYQNHLAVTEEGVMAYAGVPLRTASGQIIGSFCAIDNQPLEWTERDVKVLTFLADMIMREVTLRQTARLFNANFQGLQEAQAQRDGLVHTIAHDLRIPLASLVSGLRLLSEKASLDDSSRQLLDIAMRDANSLSAMMDTIAGASRDDSAEPDSSSART